MSKSENLRLSLLEISRILNQLIAIICLIVDSGPVIHGTERSRFFLMGLFNLNSSLIKCDLVSIISYMIIFFEKFNHSRRFWVFKISSRSSSLGFFLSFFLLGSFRVKPFVLLVVIFSLVMVIIRLGSRLGGMETLGAKLLSLCSFQLRWNLVVAQNVFLCLSVL